MLFRNNHLRKTTASIILGAFLLSGCATLFKGSSEELQANSNPNSEVYVNGSYRGDTPVRLNLKSDEEYDIRFEREGYETKTVHVSNSVGAGWVVLDVLGGLVPVIVDAATGAWHTLDQESVNATLDEQGS
jgi:hypothetical protein